jgi:hypothetical protein
MNEVEELSEKDWPGDSIAANILGEYPPASIEGCRLVCVPPEQI